jgi:hypothetical protein
VPPEAAIAAVARYPGGANGCCWVPRPMSCSTSAPAARPVQ